MSKLTSLFIQIEIESESDIINSILKATATAGRFLISGPGGEEIDALTNYSIRNLSAPVDADIMQTLEVGKYSTRYRMFLENQKDVEDANVRKVAGTNSVSFSSAGDAIKFLMESNFPLPTVGGSEAVAEQPSRFSVTIPGLSDVGDGSYNDPNAEGEIAVNEFGSLIGNVTLVDAGSITQLVADFSAIGLSSSFEDGDFVVVIPNNDYELSTGAGATVLSNDFTEAQAAVAAVDGTKPSGIVLDQFSGQVYLVDVESFAVADARLDDSNRLAEISRVEDVESSLIFE